MASKDRSIVVRLRAEIADFKQKMGEAAKSTEQVGKAADTAGKQGQGALSKLGQSARENADAWQSAGRALMVFGGAVTGVAALVLKTGIEYNTLQQTTRAALTTLTGSAQAANAQMDKLDEFARTSPFAKQTFIQAQQQMMAFGIETGKVLPYLDAVQNAVAAMGGGNQQISEISYIMSQISAASKITATDLMQFGQRGVDAATLIGSQMGMTGAEIREAITDGSLDAQVALDALAAGMQERFGGAADNVKNTFEGALDRVKAAWRDFASTIAEPLVDPEGGGMLVDFLNTLADGMRQFQEMPDWAQTFIAGGAGIAGVLALITGAAVTAIPKLLAFKTQMATLGITMRTAAIGFGIASVAIAALAAGLTIWATNSAEARSRSRTYAEAAREIGDAARQAAADVATLNIITGDTVSWGVWEQARSGYGSLAEALDGLGSSAAEAGAALAGSQEDFEAYLNTLDDGAFNLADVEVIAKLQEQRTALLAAREEVGRLDEAGVSLTETNYALADSTEASTAAAEEAARAWNEQIQAYANADASFIDILGAYRDVIDGNIELAQATADATSSSKDSWEDFYDGVSFVLDDYLKKLEEQVAAQQSWEQNMILLAGRVSQGTIDELARLGPEGAPLVAELVTASDDELARLEEVFAQRGDEATTSFADTLRRASPILAAIGEQLGQDAADEAAAAIAAGEATIQDTIDNYSLQGVTFPVNADTDPAWDDLNRFRAIAARQTITIQARVAGDPNYSPYQSTNMVRRASGGPVFGAGTETSDSIGAWLSHNEHVLSAREVKGLGGHMQVERLRGMARTGFVPRFANGGSPWSRPVVNVSAPESRPGPLVHVERVVEGTPTDVGREVAWALLGGV